MKNNMTRTTLITLIILLLILSMVGYFTWKSFIKVDLVDPPVSAAFTALTGSSTAQGFTDFAGNPANLEQHVGDIIVAHTWASWVPTSPESLRNLAAVQAEYRDQNVVVLAINRGESTKIANQFLEHYKIKNVTLISDDADQYFDTVGGRTMPETIFYDVAGNVVYHKRGVATLDELRAYVEQAIIASK